MQCNGPLTPRSWKSANPISPILVRCKPFRSPLATPTKHELQPAYLDTAEKKPSKEEEDEWDAERKGIEAEYNQLLDYRLGFSGRYLYADVEDEAEGGSERDFADDED